MLPQGSPTSPILSNFICQSIDNRIISLCKKYRLDYTRYADDLSFSTNDKSFLKHYENFIYDLKLIINRSGFKINEKKTRLLFNRSQQKVTGIVVNDRINIDRKYYKNTRAMAHNLYTSGHFYIDGEFGHINLLEGRFSFINAIDKSFNIYEKSRLKNNKNNKNTIYNLNLRERNIKSLFFLNIFMPMINHLLLQKEKLIFYILKLL